MKEPHHKYHFRMASNKLTRVKTSVGGTNPRFSQPKIGTGQYYELLAHYNCTVRHCWPIGQNHCECFIFSPAVVGFEESY